MNNLLPLGFYDLLFDEAEQNHRNINATLEVFLQRGYRLIKTPLVEFAGTFNATQNQNSFQTVDVISGKNLVFRSDITPQISRLLNARLKNQTLPIKLCYSGDVLKTRNDDLYVDRQQSQVGIEIIGCDLEQSNFEIVETALNALKKVLVRELLIEFSLPNFLEIFLEELLSEEERGDQNFVRNLMNAIRKKSTSEIRILLPREADVINKIALSNGDLEMMIREIKKSIQSKKILHELNRAQKISEFILKGFGELKLCFDLFGEAKDSYHRDIAFDIFCGDFPYPIVRGGRYQILVGEGEVVRGVDAVGATIYVNHLRKL